MTLSTRILSGHGDSRPNKAAPIVSQIERRAKPPVRPEVRQHPQEVREHQAVPAGTCRGHHSAPPHGCTGVSGASLDRRRARRPAAIASERLHVHVLRERRNQAARGRQRPGAAPEGGPGDQEADQAADAGDRRRHDAWRACRRAIGQATIASAATMENADGCRRWRDPDERSAGAVVLDEDEQVEPGKRPDGHADVARGRPAVLDLETCVSAASSRSRSVILVSSASAPIHRSAQNRDSIVPRPRRYSVRARSPGDGRGSRAEGGGATVGGDSMPRR